MLTVPEAARRAGRDPETIRRWIRSGRLTARKIGTQHVIEEEDLAMTLAEGSDISLPREWATTRSGRPMPNVVIAVTRSRLGH